MMPLDLTRRDLLALLAVSASGVVLSRNLFASESPPLRRPIPRTGETLPAVGLGTYHAFDLDPSEAGEWAKAKEVLRLLAAGAATVVDSSPMYGRAEAAIGTLARDLGLAGKLFLATKVWVKGKSEGKAQMDASFAKLRTTRIDLMQVHNLLDAATHLDTLAGWKDEGRVRYVGITHWRDDAHDELSRWMETRDIDFVQLNYSAGERAAEARALKVAADRGVAVIVNRPFGQGEMLRRARGAVLPDWARTIGAASWAQVFLKYVLAHPSVTCAIPATRNPAHLVDNLAAMRGPLPDAELRSRIAKRVDEL